MLGQNKISQSMIDAVKSVIGEDPVVEKNTPAMLSENKKAKKMIADAEMDETGFHKAAHAAKRANQTHFEFMGKKYPVTAKSQAEGVYSHDVERAFPNGKASGVKSHPALVKTNKPIGTRVSDIGKGGKEHNVKTDKEWNKQKGVSEDYVDENTGVTDYNPKSQGGTRKELLAMYAKSGDPKHAEAARKAGATQSELKAASMKKEENKLDEELIDFNINPHTNSIDTIRELLTSGYVKESKKNEKMMLEESMDDLAKGLVAHMASKGKMARIVTPDQKEKEKAELDAKRSKEMKANAAKIPPRAPGSAPTRSKDLDDRGYGHGRYMGDSVELSFKDRLLETYGKMKDKGDTLDMNEKEMTDAQMKKREKIVMSMKDNQAGFKKKYGKNWKNVMYATATKQAMKEDSADYYEEEYEIEEVGQIDELSKKTLSSYIDKAKDRYVKHASSTGLGGSDEKRDSDNKKSIKYAQNMLKAKNKMEEVEVTESAPRGQRNQDSAIKIYQIGKSKSPGALLKKGAEDAFEKGNHKKIDQIHQYAMSTTPTGRAKKVGVPQTGEKPMKKEEYELDEAESPFTSYKDKSKPSIFNRVVPSGGSGIKKGKPGVYGNPKKSDDSERDLYTAAGAAKFAKDKMKNEANDSHTHAAHYEDKKTGEWSGMKLIAARDDQDAIKQAHKMCDDSHRLTKVERHMTVKEAFSNDTFPFQTFKDNRAEIASSQHYNDHHKITTDTLGGRVEGGKMNSFRNFKVNLAVAREEDIPKEIEHGIDTREKQKITTNPGPVEVKLDDKLTGPTPHTHFKDPKKVTSEEVRGELKHIRATEKKMRDKEIADFKKMHPVQTELRTNEAFKGPEAGSGTGDHPFVTSESKPLAHARDLAKKTMKRMKQEMLGKISN